MLRRELRSLLEELDTVVARALEENQDDLMRLSKTTLKYVDYSKLYLAKKDGGLVWRFCEVCGDNYRAAVVEVDGLNVVASLGRYGTIVIDILTKDLKTYLTITIELGRRAIILSRLIPLIFAEKDQHGVTISQFVVSEETARVILEWVRRNREAIKNIVYKILSAPADEENIAEIYEKILLDKDTHRIHVPRPAQRRRSHISPKKKLCGCLVFSMLHHVVVYKSLHLAPRECFDHPLANRAYKDIEASCISICYNSRHLNLVSPPTAFNLYR